MINYKKLIVEVELHLEMLDLKKIGLSREELEGLIDFYIDEWIDEYRIKPTIN